MKKLLFSDYGCDVYQEESSKYVYFDSGESIVSKLLKAKLNDDFFDKLKKSEQDAYEVLLLLGKSCIKVEDEDNHDHH